MHRLTLAIGTALLLSLAVSPAQAGHTASGTYSLSATPVVSVVCSPDCLGIAGANLGGYQFAPNGEVPVHVLIQDASGLAVGFTVCQDLNGDSLCGDVGEPNVIACGTSADLEGFRASQVTSVFVRLADDACAGSASSGTISLSYA